MSKYRTAYAPEFRQQLIELVHAGRSANDVAKEFGLHATTVAKWVRLSPMGMPAAVSLPKSNVQQGPLNSAERQELVELRRKLRQLQMGSPRFQCNNWRFANPALARGWCG